LLKFFNVIFFSDITAKIFIFNQPGEDSPLKFSLNNSAQYSHLYFNSKNTIIFHAGLQVFPFGFAWLRVFRQVLLQTKKQVK
jgi:hypothetical protein